MPNIGVIPEDTTSTLVANRSSDTKEKDSSSTSDDTYVAAEYIEVLPDEEPACSRGMEKMLEAAKSNHGNKSGYTTAFRSPPPPRPSDQVREHYEIIILSIIIYLFIYLFTNLYTEWPDQHKNIYML